MTIGTILPREREQARRDVDWFIRRFDTALRESYLDLACHAALPLVLTPDLLHDLRTTFLYRDAPMEAEADLLLSDLCEQVGYEQYTMDTSVRAYLISVMSRRAGVERIQDVARRLIHYVQQLPQTNPWIGRHERQAQQWAAMVYLEDQRGATASEIARAIHSCVSQRSDQFSVVIDEDELLRLSNIVAELAPQLASYPELVWYAEQITRLLMGELIIENSRSEAMNNPVVIGDVVLPPFATLLSTAEQLEQPAPSLVHTVLLGGDTQALGNQLADLDASLTLFRLFYTLWANCYTGIALEIKRFSSDEMSRDNVQRYFEEFNHTINSIHEALQNTHLSAEEKFWEHDLIQAQRLLQSAIDRMNVTQLRHANNLIGNVLDLQPALLNRHAEQIFVALKLPEVVSGLRARQKDILLADLDQADVEQFAQGMAELETLQQSLVSLIRDHTTWQKVDLELRRIEQALDWKSQELELYWPHVKIIAAPLYRGHSEPWARAIEDVSVKLDRALEENDLSLAISYFHTYRARAGNRLYMVIRQIKDILEHLRRVDLQLAIVLEKVE